MGFRNILTSFFSKQNVGKQRRALYICTVALPLILIGLVIYTCSCRQITQNYEHLSDLKARQVRSVLMTTTLNLQDIYNTLMADKDLSAILAEDFADQTAAAVELSGYSRFNDILENNATNNGHRLYGGEYYIKSKHTWNNF